MLTDFTSFNWADYAIIGIIVFSTLVSLVRGFVRECISLATWTVAFLVAFKYGSYFAKFLSSYISNSSVQLITSFAILFVVTLILGALINFFISLMVMKTGLSGTDRVLGMFFGAARGILLVTIMLLLIANTSFVKDEWWKDSYFIPHFKVLITWMQEIIPGKVTQVTKYLQNS